LTFCRKRGSLYYQAPFQIDQIKEDKIMGTAQLMVYVPNNFTVGERVIFKDEWHAKIEPEIRDMVVEGRVPIVIHEDRHRKIVIYALPADLEKCHNA
jgi:hypothetical protein